MIWYRIITYYIRTHTIGDFHAFEAGTTMERILSYARYPGRNINAFEAGAITERTVSYFCYAGGDFNAGEAGATRKRIITNACYAIGNYAIFATGYKSICFRFYDGVAITAIIVNCIICCNNYSCETGAIRERTTSYCRYTVGDF